MSVIRDNKETSREFVGKGWVNTVNKPQSKAHGQQFINITLDKDVSEISIKAGERLQLWPNDKREGKNDADYRVSIVSTN